MAHFSDILFIAFLIALAVVFTETVVKLLLVFAATFVLVALIFGLISGIDYVFTKS